MNLTQLKIILIFILTTCFRSIAQDIITADGHSMGPKHIFMEVCTNNMSGNMPDGGTVYSVNDFCNCMADELLPTYTKSQINYYFTQGHMAEMFKDSTSSEIIFTCVLKNISKEVPPPPPPVELIAAEENEPLIDSIVIICNYKDKFHSIREERLKYYAAQNHWDDKTVKDIQSKVKFSEFEQWKFYSGYSMYSREELIEIIEYFGSMSPEELERSEVKYEGIILTNFGHKVDHLIMKAGGLK